MEKRLADAAQGRRLQRQELDEVQAKVRPGLAALERWAGCVCCVF